MVRQKLAGKALFRKHFLVQRSENIGAATTSKGDAFEVGSIHRSTLIF
jgi:hypothetical protein